ncbi:MAG: ABC transporter ATP-binding protein, partial [Clostridia bacterium]|nr:ABC transporter ATP-binding protein [Clostridia bacterium]
MQNNNEVLLKVEHLCQYFKMEGGFLKAVDDVNFEVKKGEVFGLVGESGCGKTTTGRSIIKLYDITGGNVYFKGKRIAAGRSRYIDAIKAAKEEYKNSAKTAEDKAKMQEIISENKKHIKEALKDQKNCDKVYMAEQVALVEEKYKNSAKT